MAGDGPFKKHDKDSSLIVRTDEVKLIRTDVRNSQLTFVGRATRMDTPVTDAEWQVSRITVAGTETVKEFAADGAYNQIYADRDTLFGAVPFANLFSIQFDGANDCIIVDDNSAIDFDFQTESASWNCWIKTADTTGSVTYLEKQGGTNPGWRFHLASNRLTLELKGTGGVSDRIRVRGPTGTGALINDGEWHLLSVTMDTSGAAAGVNIYVDGVALTPLDIQNDGLVTSTSNSVTMAVAGRTGGGGAYGPGNIDEISIHDVELTSDEIVQIYNAGIPIGLQSQGTSPITTSLNYWNRMGDGPNDVFPNIEDVEDLINGVMTNMTAGDIESVVPS